ncbi:DUF3413 domain-containing protein [Oceaniserpentilla sp. 4NH20-0058]|uniref:sulfatase-like hydrolase/transferase n=1 Tax=Oceaniserpentilla sp. 4NH20-0058 TaxID=3127660 RepID=UPI0031096205
MAYLKQVWLVNRAIAWLLLLNVVLISLISTMFAKHFPDATAMWDLMYQVALLPSVWGLYAILAIVLISPLSLIPYSRWPLQVITIGLCGNLAVVVFIDSYIYDIYNYHVNWFFIEAFWADEGGEFFDVSLKTYLIFSFVAALIAVCQFFFLWLVNQKILKAKVMRYSGVALFALLLADIAFISLSHIKAFNESYTPITSISNHVPFYFPVQSRSEEMKKNTPNTKLIVSNNIEYPKNALQCTSMDNKPNIIVVVLESWRADTMNRLVSPNTYELSKNAISFSDHHSNGSVTTRGIFSLMYGVSPTYMDNFIANNGVGGPVFLQELKKEGYEFGVYPSGDIDRLKLTDTSFLPIREHVEHGEGSDTIEKDIDVLNKMTQKLESAQSSVFGFMFFNSTHYLYYYPESFSKFSPTQKPSLVDFKAGKNPEPFFNRYKNSIYFVDDLIGKLIKTLKETGKYDNTVLIVTSDHAEEFADTKPTRFGHGSNYTKFQTQVPLVIHWPGKEAKEVNYRTSSVDVMATLVDELLNCSNPVSDYSSGSNLFSDVQRGPQIIASYYNYAFVTPQGSFIQNPIGLPESRNNNDELDDSLQLSPKSAFGVLEKMKHFYGGNAAK